MSASKKPRSRDLRHAYERFVGNDPKRIRSFEDERANTDIALQVYDLRKEAGLTQRELAKLVGTTASVICRLEDADYQGHSLSMLRRIAHALGKRLEVRFVAEEPTAKSA